MSEIGIEIIKTEETEESGIKYLNINVSNSEVERKPGIVRLCADAGIIEYVKPKTGHWIEDLSEFDNKYPKHIQALWKCSECKKKQIRKSNCCPDCGAKMLPTDSEKERGYENRA